ncbi:MAG: CPBP family intramembrane metalloprotease [Acidobacteria bacterium]|nr:CPBP family intramembrane metalloprotease [Acidobacteriota bacterium]MCW5970462.1 CPBP family intramembrane metalloprotease [Blastocatellales bacterium]
MKKESTASVPFQLSLRAVTCLEIASVLVSAFIALWVVVPLYPGNRWLIAAVVLGAAALMIHSHRVRGETLEDLGFSSRHFRRAAVLLAAPTIGAMTLLLAIGYKTGGLHIDDHFWRKLVLLPIGGVVQQYALQGFIYRRVRTLTANRTVAGAGAAALFALVHLPNPALMLMTFLGGVVWTRVYERAPNLFALGLSHGALSLAVLSTLPGWMLESLSVGYKHFLYQTF